MLSDPNYKARQKQLCGRVNNAHCDPETRSFIIRQAAGILTHLGLQQDDAVEWIQQMTSMDIWDLTAHESAVHADLSKNTPVYQNLPGRMLERAKAWMDRIGPHVLPGATTLDLGGGSGEVAKALIDDYGCSTTISDKLDYRRYKDIPFRESPLVLDTQDNEFEQVVVLTVFHHDENPERLLVDAFRTASKRVIIIESITDSMMMYRYGCWIDWFYNHILQFNPDITKKIYVPCNLKSSGEWKQIIWKYTGLEPTVSKDLGIYQWLNPEFHHLLVYDK